MTYTTFLRLAAFIDEWLSRSGRLPLHISGDEIPDFMTLGKFRIIFKILNDIIRPAGIALVILHLSSHVFNQTTFRCWNSSISTSLITCLTLHTIFPPSPRLKAVGIIIGSNLLPLLDIGIKWDSVIQLSGAWLTMHDCLEFLRMFPQLVHCKFHDIILDLDYPLLESPILNRLTHFSLFCHDISLDPFLDNIVLPSVGTLVPFHIDSMDPLMTFLERSVHCTPFRWSI